MNGVEGHVGGRVGDHGLKDILSKVAEGVEIFAKSDPDFGYFFKCGDIEDMANKGSFAKAAVGVKKDGGFERAVEPGLNGGEEIGVREVPLDVEGVDVKGAGCKEATVDIGNGISSRDNRLGSGKEAMSNLVERGIGVGLANHVEQIGSSAVDP